MKINKLLIYSLASIFLFSFLISCSNDENERTTTNFRSQEKEGILKNEFNIKKETKEIKPIKLTKEEIKKFKPNELGQVMILEYHLIGYPEARWQRTPENFQKDLERLYKDNYYLVSLRDFVNNKMNVPLGKTPFILTFDDGTVGQFRYIKKGSNVIMWKLLKTL